MMYNRVFLIGNLAKDPELRYTPAGVAVCRLTVAVNRVKKSGESEADFISVVAWRRLAEICGEYLKKGKPVAVEGHLEVRAFTGKDGTPRTMVEVVMDNMQMLGSKKKEEGSSFEETSNNKEFSKENKEEEAPF